MYDLTLPPSWTLDNLIEIGTKVVVILVLALVLRWVAKKLIARVVRRASKGAVPHVMANTKAGALLSDLRPAAKARREQRAGAMGDLLTSIVTIVIVAFAIVSILGAFNINIAPILTGAGIVGVALGFGAQTLVKDFLAGLFMILEDQYGVGDSVDLGEATGTVEATGLRVTRIRDVNGTVWYVRNGEILRVGNESQNWARSVLDITVAYDSDLDEVQSILSREAHTMYEAPEYKGIILEDPEVWGVERFDKDGVVVRLVVKTAPQQQWAVSRALRERIKNAFDVAGIEIPTMSFPTQPA